MILYDSKAKNTVELFNASGIYLIN